MLTSDHRECSEKTAGFEAKRTLTDFRDLGGFGRFRSSKNFRCHRMTNSSLQRGRMIVFCPDMLFPFAARTSLAPMTSFLAAADAAYTLSFSIPHSSQNFNDSHKTARGTNNRERQKQFRKRVRLEQIHEDQIGKNFPFRGIGRRLWWRCDLSRTRGPFPGAS